MSTTYFALGDYAAKGSDTGTRLRAATAAAVINNPLGLLIADRIARESRPPAGREDDRNRAEDDVYRGNDERDRGGYEQQDDLGRLTSNEAVMVAALSEAANALGRIATALEAQVDNQNQLFERLATGDVGAASTGTRSRRSNRT